MLKNIDKNQVMKEKKERVLPSPSSLCLLHDRPINQRRGAEARNTTLFRKLADREYGILKSQNNHLIGVWMPVSFIAQRR